MGRRRGRSIRSVSRVWVRSPHGLGLQVTPVRTLAVVADIHGNRWALEAVLDDLERRDVSEFVNLGDSVYGPLDPAGTARLLRKVDPPSVRGNQDRILVDPPEEIRGSPTYEYVRSSLTDEDLEWIAGHSRNPLELDGVLACHGTPTRDDDYLVEAVGPSGVELRGQAKLRDLLDAFEQAAVLCGHSHVPRLVQVGAGQVIVNPGSVGLPAYSDDSPYPHAMEAGSAHARYALLTKGPEGWDVDHVAVTYEWTRAAAAAEYNGRPDWGTWIRTGRATPNRQQ